MIKYRKTQETAGALKFDGYSVYYKIKKYIVC